jgi:hypothetical protein
LIHASKAFGKTEDRNSFMKAWAELVSSGTDAIYEERWSSLQDTFDTSAPELVSYIRDTWLAFWKQLIVQAYTDKHLHLGNRATSRVEGAHAVLKSYLQVSTGDLKTVYDKITLLLNNQYAEYEGALAQNKARTPHTASGPLYSQLIGQVSNFALGRLWDQHHQLSSLETLGPCTNTFSSSMGMPYAHYI